VVFGRHLNKVARLEMPEGGILPRTTIEIASDVDNTFVGDHGAVAVRGKLVPSVNCPCCLLFMFSSPE